MLLDSFAAEMNQTLTPMVKTVTRNADYSISTTWAAGQTSYKVCVYSKAIAEKYFGVGLWKESVKMVAVAKPFDLAPDVRVTVGNVTYAVDSVDDVAMQGEVMLIGLRAAV